LTPRVVFMGSPEFSVPTLRSLCATFDVVGVVTQPDRPKGRGKRPVPTPVKAAAVERGLQVVEPDDLSSEEFLVHLRGWAPDVIVVAAYGKILPKSILRLPPMGCVNLHASLLPRHRGASPITATILAGDEVAGVCTIVMDEGMDTGDVLLSQEIPILAHDSTGTLHDRMLEPGAELVVRTLKAMADGTVSPQRQSHADATLSRPLSKEDGRIDWKMDAEFLGRLVRAMNPWPGAFTDHRGGLLRIWEATPKEGDAQPGVVISVDADGISVGTGRGVLMVKEVQASGKKRMPAADFARGRRITAGESL
jgi:methionyl-tRNA formyltransferase